MCLLLEGRLSLHDFVCNRVLFSLNKEFFRYCEKSSFWGKTSFLFSFSFFFFLGGGGGWGGGVEWGGECLLEAESSSGYSCSVPLNIIHIT